MSEAYVRREAEIINRPGESLGKKVEDLASLTIERVRENPVSYAHPFSHAIVLFGFSLSMLSLSYKDVDREAREIAKDVFKRFLIQENIFP